MKEILDQFIAKALEKNKLDAELDAVKRDLETLQTQLLATFEESGVSSVVHGNYTVGLRRDVYANIADGADTEFKRLLYANGLSHLMVQAVPSARLSALYREHERGDHVLPDALVATLKISEKYSVRLYARNGKKKEEATNGIQD